MKVNNCFVCGGKAEAHYKPAYNTPHYARVVCEKCGIKTNWIWGFTSNSCIKKAEKKWNNKEDIIVLPVNRKRAEMLKNNNPIPDFIEIKKNKLIKCDKCGAESWEYERNKECQVIGFGDAVVKKEIPEICTNVDGRHGFEKICRYLLFVKYKETIIPCCVFINHMPIIYIDKCSQNYWER